jgi:TolB-like protein
LIYQFDQVVLDTEQFRLSRSDKLVPVEPQVFDLLVYLITHRNRVVSRDELFDSLWKGKIVTDATLGVRLKDVRKAIGDSGNKQALIKTIRGRGYQFIGKIEVPPTNTLQSVEEEKVTPSPSQPSVVVLPFSNPGQSDEKDYFADGLTDDITINLSHYRELLVIDHHSAIAERGDITNDEQFALALGVEYMVKGSIRHYGDQIKVSVQLVEAATSRSLWAVQLDRSLDELFNLEDEIVAKIVSRLISIIENESSVRAKRKPPSNMSAYDCVSRAKANLLSYDPKQNATARVLLEQAIKLDPEFATAYSYLSWSCAVEAEAHWCTHQAKTLDQAIDYAQKALSLDESDSNAHTGMAWALMYQKKFELSEIYVNRAIECNPNNYHAYCIKTFLFALTGRTSDVTDCGAATMKRNPFAPDDCLMAMIISRYLSGEHELALDLLDRIRAPGEASETMRAVCLAQLSRDEEVALAAAKAREFTSGLSQGKEWLLLSPFKSPKDLQYLIEGLEKAGMLSNSNGPKS